jgi:hypothetical protein
MSTVPEANPTDSEKSQQCLIAAILQSGVDLFADPTGIAQLRRPTDGPGDWGWPVNSEVATAYIAKFAYVRDGTMLKGSDLNAVLRILTGFALENVRRDVAVCDLIENDPLLRAVIRLLTSASHWRGPAAKLLIALRAEMADESIEFNRDKAWPKDPARLSVRLRDLKPAFERLGISHSRSRTARQRSHTLERVRDHLPHDDAGASSLSSISSSPNAGASGPLRMNDGGDGQMEDFAECPAD